jgi:membrane protease YdiL (CAAX protease family)
MVAIEIAISALIFAIAERMDPSGWRALGFWRGGHARAALAALSAYGLALPGLIGIVPLWQAFLDRVGVGYEPQHIAELALALRGPALVAFLLMAVAIVPFFEELFFRGFLQPLLVQNLGDRGGVVVTSLIFAGLHGLSAGVPIFALSLVLGALMLRTQRLTASWLVHALHNGSMLALLFLVPESERLLGQ